AARCTTVSTPCRHSAITAWSVKLPQMNRPPRGKIGRCCPTERLSSTTMSDALLAHKCCTRLAPMKPAPPVTSTRMLVHLEWSIDRGPAQQSYHHFETQGIFVRSQLLAYFLAISLISPSKLVLSMIGSRPRPIRLRFSTYRSFASASL